VIDEFSRVENLKGQRAANVLTAPKARRQKVAEALAAQPIDEWVQIDDLFRQMQRTAWSPRVARSDRALWKLYLQDPRYGSLGYAGFGDWEILEGRYTVAVLFEYAATLGLIDVAYDEASGARDDYHENWAPTISRHSADTTGCARSVSTTLARTCWERAGHTRHPRRRRQSVR
jgi:hypothetical protein